MAPPGCLYPASRLPFEAPSCRQSLLMVPASPQALTAPGFRPLPCLLAGPWAPGDRGLGCQWPLPQGALRAGGHPWQSGMCWGCQDSRGVQGASAGAVQGGVSEIREEGAGPGKEGQQQPPPPGCAAWGRPHWATVRFTGQPQGPGFLDSGGSRRPLPLWNAVTHVQKRTPLTAVWDVWLVSGLASLPLWVFLLRNRDSPVLWV